VHESGIDQKTAADLRKIAEKIRGMKDRGLDEGVSTRLLIYAGILIKKGVEPRRACTVALVKPITDDSEIQRTLEELVTAVL